MTGHANRAKELSVSEAKVVHDLQLRGSLRIRVMQKNHP